MCFLLFLNGSMFYQLSHAWTKVQSSVAARSAGAHSIELGRWQIAVFSRARLWFPMWVPRAGDSLLAGKCGPRVSNVGTQGYANQLFSHASDHWRRGARSEPLPTTSGAVGCAWTSSLFFCSQASHLRCCLAARFRLSLSRALAFFCSALAFFSSSMSNPSDAPPLNISCSLHQLLSLNLAARPARR